MSTSPSKAATPASDAAAVEKSLFTPKEEAALKVAWLCLKSGPPDVDMAKFQKMAGFNTTKTASNTWGVIKKKLLSLAPKEDGAEDGAEGAEAETPKTPAKPKAKAKAASPTKKRTKKSEDGDDDDEEKTASPEKKPRKSPVKKTKKAATPVEDEEETSDVKMEGAEAETE
ncbi:hypothetical protein LTR97_011911 [Elasticomyces elasticus]|uniref:Uncharacterized protein n=1 Tax=Elasticomyces elasticus TaxID=574655 RepID=A0AAN7VL42_9PEZI|nr:hypothetical protein LTR97_011911 [Elasticomyces elasticus]KAK5717691.1 hypothetical protein LTR15_008530 [Elasticomyces elasticus]